MPIFLQRLCSAFLFVFGLSLIALPALAQSGRVCGCDGLYPMAGTYMLEGHPLRLSYLQDYDEECPTALQVNFTSADGFPMEFDITCLGGGIWMGRAPNMLYQRP